MPGRGSLTARLEAYLRGDRHSQEELLQEILPKLHEIAVRELNRERYIAPLSKTELIHELWLRNLSGGGWEIRDRGHFFALASLAMRRVLVDLARKRLTARRGGANGTISLDNSSLPIASPPKDAEQIVAIGLLLDRLEQKDPDAARAVDMHYFSGFTLEEIAGETGLSVKQVRARWERGLKWLKNMLRAQSKNGRSITSPDA